MVQDERHRHWTPDPCQPQCRATPLGQQVPPCRFAGSHLRRGCLPRCEPSVHCRRYDRRVHRHGPCACTYRSGHGDLQTVARSLWRIQTPEGDAGFSQYSAVHGPPRSRWRTFHRKPSLRRQRPPHHQGNVLPPARGTVARHHRPQRRGQVHTMQVATWHMGPHGRQGSH